MSAVKLDKLHQPALAQAQHVDRRRELRVVDGEVPQIVAAAADVCHARRRLTGERAGRLAAAPTGHGTAHLAPRR